MIKLRITMISEIEVDPGWYDTEDEDGEEIARIEALSLEGSPDMRADQAALEGTKVGVEVVR